jgi:beta-lactamase regulating signal transducer with metallopeptidase domain/uncharacterized GH25 family protein
MSSVMSRMNWSLVCGFGATLFVQSSLVLLLGLATSWLVRGRNAAARSAILHATLAAVILCGAVSPMLHSVGLPVLQIHCPRSVEQFKPEPVVATSRGPASTEIQAIPPAPSRPPTSLAAISTSVETAPIASAPLPSRFLTSATVQPILGLLWIGVATLLVARLLIANILLANARRASRQAGDSVRCACQRIAARLGLDAPDVRISPKFGTPCLTGWLRPAIFLPQDAADPPDSVLTHELAHVVRRDCLWHLLATGFAAVLWFQPLAWLLVRQIERSAEEACDDLVLAEVGDRAAYARRLLELAESSQSRWAAAVAGVGVIAIRSSVGRRVQRLLDLTHQPRTHVGRRTLVALVLGIPIVATSAGVMTASFAAAPAQSAVPQLATQQAPTQQGTYRGHVFLPDGKPAANADVFLARGTLGEEQIIASAKSDAQGLFSLSRPLEDPHKVRLDLQTYLPGHAVATRWAEPGDQNEVRLADPTSVTLTFVGPTGIPVAGMRVTPVHIFSARPIGSQTSESWYMFLPVALSQRLGGTTNAAGKVKLADLPRDSLLRVGFSDERFALPGLREQIRLADDPTTPPVTVRLKAGATITGRVAYDPAGKPAAGIRVYAQATERNMDAGGATAVTDQAGAFRMTQLRPGEFNVMLGLEGQLERDWTAFAHEGVRVEAGQTLNGIDFKLIKGGLVRGKVTKADTGEPITDTEVGAHTPAHPQSSASVQGTQVGPDGSYTLRVPPGTQHVYVMGLLPEAYRQREQDIRDVSVADGQTVSLDFQVPRRPGKPVEGIVLDGDGKPAPDVVVTAIESGMVPFESVSRQTDARGRFRFDVLNPGTELTARDRTRATAKPVHVDGGELDVKLRLSSLATINIGGSVTDMAGKPIPGARVELSEWHGQFGSGSGAPIRTGPDGRYLLKNLSTVTQYSVAAEADGYGEAQMKIPTDGVKEDLPPLKLAKADAVVSGQVVDDDGKPVKGIPVMLSGNMFPKTTVTDAQGRFSFPAVYGQRLIASVRQLDGGQGPVAQVSGGHGEVELILHK